MPSLFFLSSLTFSLPGDSLALFTHHAPLTLFLTPTTGRHGTQFLFRLQTTGRRTANGRSLFVGDFPFCSHKILLMVNEKSQGLGNCSYAAVAVLCSLLSCALALAMWEAILDTEFTVPW